jgi:putative ABC transport system permease protein
MASDLRYAARALFRAPGFAVAVIGSLALGIAANTALFSVVDAVFLRPLPYERPDELFSVTQPRRVPPIEELRHAKSLSGVAAYTARNFPVTDKDGVRLVFGGVASGDMFRMLGIHPLIGRISTTDDETQPVVMLGYEYWRRISGDPGILGKTITIDEIPRTVIGVLPQDFVLSFRDGNLWLPVRMTDGRLLARARPGVTRAQAEAEAAGIIAGLPPDPGANRDGRVHLEPLASAILPNDAGTMLLWQAAVALVLLITCANVANLMLVRASARRREFAVRAAMGAGRMQVVRQLLAESVLLAFAGGMVGVLIAAWSLDYLERFLPGNFSRILRGGTGLSLDWRVIAFAAAACLVTAVLFGIAPAINALRIDVIANLRDTARGATPERQRAGYLLVASEVTLAVMLLIGAGLTLKSLTGLRHQNLGFSADHVLRAAIDLPPAHYREPRQRVAAFSEIERRLGAMPGVEAVGALVPQLFPFGGPRVRGSIFEIQNRAGEEARAEMYVANAAYLRSVQIPLVRGRWFAEEDTLTSGPVAVVSQSVADRYWPADDPLGREIRVERGGAWLTIVGVIGDIRNPVGAGVQPTIYRPFAQVPSAGAALFIRTTGDPMALIPAVNAEVRAVDRGVPELRTSNLAKAVADYVTPQQFTTTVFGFFSVLGLLLAAVGVYGVMRYWVAMRIPEFGVRLAIGAKRSDVLRLVLSRAVRAALIGVAAGIAGALALQKIMATQLYNVSATDPAIFTVVPVMVAIAVLIAAFVPAWWASRVDPIAALRHE